jgi:hypothetical protein
MPALAAPLLLPLQLPNAAAATVCRFSPDNEFGIHVMGTDSPVESGSGLAVVHIGSNRTGHF